jgi:hypothetical protein
MNITIGFILTLIGISLPFILYYLIIKYPGIFILGLIGFFAFAGVIAANKLVVLQRLLPRLTLLS